MSSISCANVDMICIFEMELFTAFIQQYSTLFYHYHYQNYRHLYKQSFPFTSNTKYTLLILAIVCVLIVDLQSIFETFASVLITVMMMIMILI
jgi:hypothetical protein